MSKRQNLLSLPCGKRGTLCRAAVCMPDIGHHAVGMLQHPAIAAANRIAARCKLHLLGQQGFRILYSGQLLLRHISKHNTVAYLRINLPA